jgi:response regulator RpfG family c-di-GMP phosphodiesterase
MMPNSMEALRGTRLLLVGPDGDAMAVRARLEAAGAVVAASVADAEAAVRATLAEAPAAVVALGGSEEEVRERLDPLRLGGGPPVITLAELVAADEDLGAPAAARLRAVVERRALRQRQSELESVVSAQAVARRREVEAAQLDALKRLAMAAEYRDDNTHEHTERVGELAARLSRALGLDDRTVWLVRQAAPLHDLGKIAIPDSILLKPGRLNEEEFEVVKTHAVLGARVLGGGASDLLEVAERIARAHHERWDGTGYPTGLAGETIPLVGRIVHVADVFDVLVHERPYKESWTVEAAAEEIRRGAGTQFDPDVVRAFEQLGPRVWRADPHS